MRLKSLALAAAAVTFLTFFAAAGEEPPTQPAPVATPATATPAAVPDGPERGQWGWGPTPRELFVQAILSLWKQDVLALVLLGYFIAGLKNHRHDWKPLVLGLFALGLGALETTYWLIDGLSILARKGVANPADLCECGSKALVYLFLGLVLAMAGGLFTVILRWRNERFRELEATEVSEPGSDQRP